LAGAATQLRTDFNSDFGFLSEYARLIGLGDTADDPGHKEHKTGRMGKWGKRPGRWKPGKPPVFFVIADMFLRTHHTIPDPKPMRMMPLARLD
jgi:hypothetical protein